MKKGNRKVSSSTSTSPSPPPSPLLLCLLSFIAVYIVLISSSSSSSSSPLLLVSDSQITIEKSLEATVRRGQQYIRRHSNNETSSSSNVDAVNIVIGIGQDIDPKNFAVFCKSLREASDADAVIFMNKPINTRNSDIAAKLNVRIIEYSIDDLSSDMRRFHPSTTRYHLFYTFFSDERVRSSYSNVFMIDVRDSYFQLDPFKVIVSGNDAAAFHVFTSVTTVTIGKCGWNGKWILDCFGQGTLNDIGDNSIICSGVSLGTMDSVYNYLVNMNDIITGSRQTEIGKLSKFPSCERNGVDQGAHNVLVYKGAIPRMKIWDQIEGPVSNLQAEQYQLKENVVFNRKGAKAAVVHQYDRSQILQRYLFKRYVDWTNTDDPQAEWTTTAACNKFTSSWHIDLFSGICDLSMRGGATSPSSCCSLCLSTDRCKSFTYFNAKCFLKTCSTSDNMKSGKHIKDAVSAQLTE